MVIITLYKVFFDCFTSSVINKLMKKNLYNNFVTRFGLGSFIYKIHFIYLKNISYSKTF